MTWAGQVTLVAALCRCFPVFGFDPYFANGGKFEPHMSSILHQFAFAAGIVAIRLHWLKIVKRSVAVALAGITQKLKTH